jgi:oxalate---CoA ligase
METPSFAGSVHEFHGRSRLADVHALLRRWARRQPDAEALAAHGRPGLGYAELVARLEYIAATLRQLGAVRGTRVAVAMPQGADFAVAVFGAALGAVAAPLQPGSHISAVRKLFDALLPDMLLTLEAYDTPAREVARERGIPVLEAAPEPRAAGCFRIAAAAELAADANPGRGFSGPDDIALLLATSGTTSASKLVPLTHGNICTAAANTAMALRLGPDSRCLNVMPLFHGHGLVAAVLATWTAGGTVMCTPGFDARRFREWFDGFNPTWFTAVPTMHQAILEEEARQGRRGWGNLTFIRSASATLPASVQGELEWTFGVPVTESYGLTEALQLTNTSLVAGERKPGSLGRPGSSEIAIVDEHGNFVPVDTVGEIVCRGPVVMAGYLGAGNDQGDFLPGGWFRTGDIGRCDEDGHLFLTGRLKDMVNRGGEKIPPHEVEAALQEHPAVFQVLVFGVPNDSVGEELVAAAVLRDGVAATPGELRRFAWERLPGFMVPRRIVIVESIPQNATGKLLRRDVAAAIADSLRILPSDAVPAAESLHPLEIQLRRIWGEVLGREVGPTDDFFDIGGTSLAAARIAAEIERVCGQRLEPSVLFAAPSLRELTLLLTQSAAQHARPRLIEVQQGSGLPPMIFIAGDFFGMGFYCRSLAAQLDRDRPFYALMPHLPGAEMPPTIEAMAESFLSVVRMAVPHGPYLLGGFSHGGLIAFEMARRLRAAGEAVPLVVIVDEPATHPRLLLLRNAIGALARMISLSAAQEAELYLTWRHRAMNLPKLWREGPLALAKAALSVLGRHNRTPWEQQKAGADVLRRVAADYPGSEERVASIAGTYAPIIRRYVPRRYAGPIRLIAARDTLAAATSDATLGWSAVSSDIRVLQVPGDHQSCIMHHADEVGHRLRAFIEELEAAPPPRVRGVEALAVSEPPRKEDSVLHDW